MCWLQKLSFKSHSGESRNPETHGGAQDHTLNAFAWVPAFAGMTG
jgi:hypothetical protein